MKTDKTSTIESSTQSSVLSPQSFLLLGLPLLLILWLLLSLLTSPLYTKQEKETTLTPVTSGTIIQSFRAEHSNLSSIQVKFLSYGSSSGATEGHLEVNLQRGALDGPLVAQWSEVFNYDTALLHTYNFPTQSDSNGQIYFLKFKGSALAEPPSLALAQAKQEVYPAGQLFVDGNPVQGDLFFIAEYSPNPGEMLRSFFDRQNGFGGAPVLALISLLLIFGLAGILLWLLGRYRKDLTTLIASGGKKPWLIFGGLLLGLRLMLSLTFMLVTPPLQGPDEPAHLGHTLHFAEGKPDSSFAPPVADLMQRTRFIENFPWLSYADNPVELYPPDAEKLQLPFYYWLAAGSVKIGNIFSTDFSFENYMARLASVFLGLITVGAGLGLGYLWRKESIGLALGLPISAALLPEVIHLTGVTNNDNGAITFGAVATWGMALLFRRGLHPLYFGLVAVGLALSIFSKASANALLPGYAIGFYILAWINLRTKWWRRALIGVPVGALLLGLVALFVLTDHGRAASAWYVTPTLDLGKHPERTQLAGAQQGQYVLKLEPQNTPVEQQANLFNRADFTRVRVTGWLRGTEGQSTTALVRIQTARDTLTEQRFDAGGTTWKSFSFEVDSNAAEINHTRVKAYLRLQLTNAGNSPIYFDNLSLSPVDSPQVNLLANPSFEETVWTWKSDWQGTGRTRRSFAADMLDAAQNGAALDYGSIFLQNCVFLFITFWGAFGWSQILFSLPVYLLCGAIFLLAVIGLLRRKAWDFSTGGRAFGLFCLLSVITTLFALQFIRLPTSWMYDGTPDLTHSRHAFAALLPQLFLLLAGLRGLRDFRVLPRRKVVAPKVENDAIIRPETVRSIKTEGSQVGTRAWIGVWAWSVFLFILSMVALLGTIFPYYYNS